MTTINILFDYNVVINTLILILFQIFFAYYIYKLKISFSILYSILFTTAVTITEISVINLLSITTGNNSKDFINNNYSYILLIVLSKSLLFLLLKIVAFIIQKFNYKEKINLLFLIYPLSLLLILTVFVVISYSIALPNNLKMIISVSSLILIVSIVCTSIYQQQTSKKEKEFYELKANQSQQELNNTYFELLEHQNNELQLFVHDTKKHFHNLYDLLDNTDKSKEYIKNIVKDIDEANNIGKTDNKLLDIIINKYIYLCKKNKIKFEKNIHYSDLNFIDDNDLTSLFNNLFDNAIDAANISKNKYISFDINKINEIIVIDIVNSCDIPPIVKEDKLISTKSDKSLHGYGFKSILRVVKKYKGDIEWEYNNIDKSFTVSILLTSKN